MCTRVASKVGQAEGSHIVASVQYDGEWLTVVVSIHQLRLLTPLPFSPSWQLDNIDLAQTHRVIVHGDQPVAPIRSSVRYAEIERTCLLSILFGVHLKTL